MLSIGVYPSTTVPIDVDYNNGNPVNPQPVNPSVAVTVTVDGTVVATASGTATSGRFTYALAVTDDVVYKVFIQASGAITKADLVIVRGLAT